MELSKVTETRLCSGGKVRPPLARVAPLSLSLSHTHTLSLSLALSLSLSLSHTHTLSLSLDQVMHSLTKTVDEMLLELRDQWKDARSGLVPPSLSLLCRVVLSVNKLSAISAGT